MARIKQVLWERRMAWLQAQEILKESLKSNSNDSTQSTAPNTPGQETNSVGVDDSLSDQDSLLEIAKIGRKKAPLAKLARIKIKKGSRPTSWKVI